jgi:hypothetical protein
MSVDDMAKNALLDEAMDDDFECNTSFVNRDTSDIQTHVSDLGTTEEIENTAIIAPPNMRWSRRMYGLSNPVQETEVNFEGYIQNDARLASLPQEEVDGSKQGLKVAGILLAVLGFVVFLFISWLIGLVVMLLGIGLWISGLSRSTSRSSSESNKQKEPVWQDVVYLKNGSVIKGIVIEQVPNISIKIQTADGSIFVYEMDQVAKIAKEQK